MNSPEPSLPNLPDKELLSTSEAGEILGVSPDAILQWLKAGEFPGAFKLNPNRKNSPIRIPRAAVIAKYQQQRRAG